MNIHNTQNILGNSIKIGSAILLIIGASLTIPKIADAALTLDRGVPEYANPAVQESLNDYREDSQDSSGYQPPDFGLPASVYGSGTR
jgi:hypothetical protein